MAARKAARKKTKRAKKVAKKRSRRKPKETESTEVDAGLPRSIVGDLVNFRGLVYSPVTEQGVVFLFGKVAGDLNMYVEEIKQGFPDCIARRYTGKGWERVRVEFEFRSSNFRQHKHDPKKCDMVVCWEHDWDTCPIEVIELRERIKEMDNPPVERPDQAVQGSQGDIMAWFKKYGCQKKSVELFDDLRDALKKDHPEVFYKVGERLVSFYCPERAFMFLYPRKNILRMNIFTNGRKMGGVKQHKFEKGAEKWGSLSISTPRELQEALPWISKSIQRIRTAIKKNENTGWYAKTEPDE